MDLLIRPIRLSDSEAINEMRRQEYVRANTLALAPELRLARIAPREYAVRFTRFARSSRLIDELNNELRSRGLISKS